MSTSRKLALYLVAYIACMSVSLVDTFGQDEVRKAFKDQFGLSFLVIPEAETAFGVGTIVDGRGKKLLVQCYASECLPARQKLIEQGTIVRDEFEFKVGTFRASKAVLAMLGLGFLGDRARYIQVELDKPTLEAISVNSVNTIYQKYLTKDGQEYMKGRSELVHKALRCEMMRLILLENSRAKIGISREKLNGSFELGSDGFAVVIRNGWIAFRALKYDFKKGSWAVGRTIGPIEPRIVVQAKETPANSKFEGTTDMAKKGRE